MSAKQTRTKSLLVIARIITTPEGYVGTVILQSIDTSPQQLEESARLLIAQQREWPTYAYLPLITPYAQPGGVDGGYREALTRAKRRVDSTIAKMNKADFGL